MKKTVALSLIGISLAASCLAQEIASPAAPQTPKPPIRLGISLPKVALGQTQARNDEAAALQTLIASNLASKNIEVVTLGALSSPLSAVEVAEKHCDYVLSVGLSQKKSGGGMGFLRSAAPLSSMIPAIGVATKASALVTQVAARASLQSIEALARSTKANNEVTLDYRLASIGGNELLSKAEKAKAQTDGQDVITAMVLHLADNIVHILQR